MKFPWIKGLKKRKPINSDIAVIGMACRFPGARDYYQFWDDLIKGINQIREITPDRWDINQYYSPDRDILNKSISKWGGLLDQIDSFDAPFFHISPREAQVMDPQQRLLLEETWHCMEDAGVLLNELQQHKTAVYVGVMAVDYQHHMFDAGHATDSYECIGNYEGILANRLSYFFNLTGESQSIDAACASSLVAVHDARKSLINSESDYAIAAGVSVICHPWRYISFSKSNMLSPDGQCKTFDAEANGYVPGEGVGVLLLCPLQKALEKGYHVYGIVKGSAVKHTGKSKSISAPRVEIERQTVEEAIASSGVSSEQITYVEAHGTGTSLGDPIEVEALTEAFHSKKKQYCRIGSVKTNIGHLEAAAGIAGVIKVLMMMQHKKIPKTLNVKNVNPIIEFEHSPFRLADELTDWQLPENISRRVAGVSSFGFGGVNAHVVLEEYPEEKLQPKQSTKALPFILSAKTEKSLQALLQQWKNYTRTEIFQSQSLEDICYTLTQGREDFSYRFGAMINGKEDLFQILEKANQDHFIDVHTDLKNKSLVLRIQHISEITYAMFHTLCEQHSLLSQLVKEHKAIIQKCEKEHPDFIVQVILGKALLISGFLPRYIIGEKIGALAAVVLSDMLDFSAAVQWLLGVESNICLKRPVIGFYDTSQQKMIESYEVSPAYCQQLIEKLKFETQATKQLLEKSRQLIENQHTFKKYVSEWESSFEKHGISIEEALKKQKELTDKQQQLLLFALFLCMKKLNQKWNLPEQIILPNNTSANEISDLLLDHLIKPEDVASLLFDPSYSIHKKIALHIKTHEYKLDRNKPYRLLKEFNQTVEEISDVKMWLDKLIRSDLKMDEVTQKIHSPLLIDIKKDIAELLMDVWCKGAEVDWQQWYPFSDYRKIALPVYPFTRERYWVAGSSESVPATAIITKALVETPTIIYSPAVSTQAQSLVCNHFLLEKVQDHIVICLAKILNLKTENLHPEEELNKYGVDSVSLTELAIAIDEYYGIELTPAVLFEYKTLSSVAEYLVHHYQAAMERCHPDTKIATVSEPSVLLPPLAVKRPMPIQAFSSQKEDIAVIGMGGIFPRSPDLNTFWDNLVQEKDLISEVPESRWDWKTYKTKAKWGGFIDGIDEFDAEFFAISSREAELMDPQQRIFLEAVWKAIEDAGYTADNLSALKTGLFVGVATHDYAGLLEKSDETSAYVPTGVFYSVLANRVSYLLNWNGPSEAIDTACSSSLVAIHHAVKAIQNGDCNIAIAGGVNALLSPNTFVAFNNAGMLCEDGRCKTFDKAANGYVRGEGAGAIVLKPLKKAVADKDHIYGVIKGSAINHGGRVNSLTVPNPHAQAEVISQACERAQVEVNTISYVETHGTGTPLGDPIEINGLKKAFQTLKEKQNKKSLPSHYCGLGSIKTNIGHLEGAAGIASVIKVLLAMQHGKLPGTVNFTELNPYIELKDSPFYIVDKTREWVRLKDEKGYEIPRRAGVSSFGFGGANAHLVIEETPPIELSQSANKPYYLVTLSAKTEQSLKQKIHDLEKWLGRHQQTVSLEDISYTVNTGRSHFAKRCALVVHSLAELQEALLKISSNQKSTNVMMNQEGIQQADQAIFKEVFKLLMQEIEKVNQISANEYRDKLSALANFYTKGYDLDWERLHHGESKRRISLPVYPFIKKRYWAPKAEPVTKEELPNTSLHPLIDADTSTQDRKRFSKKLTGEEFYLADHHVNGEPVLPAVAYIEMVRAAGALASPDQQVISLRNMIWSRPIRVTDQKVVTVELHPEESRTIFEVTTQDKQEHREGHSEPILHAQGKMLYVSSRSATKLPPLDLFAIQQRCIKKQTHDGIYTQLDTIGLHYGPSFQAIQDYSSSETEAIACLQLPAHLHASAHQFILHPSMLDGVLQASFGLLKDKKTLYLPFSIEQIDIFEPLPEKCCAYVVLVPESEAAGLPKFQIQITDKAGQVLVRLKDFTMRALKMDIVKRETGVYYYQPMWKQQAQIDEQVANLEGAVLVVDEQEEIKHALQQKFPQQIIIQVKSGENYQEIDKHIYTVRKNNTDDYLKLFKSLEELNQFPKFVIYCTAQSKPSEIYYQAFCLAQALIQQKLKQDIRLICVNDTVSPFTEALLGFVKTLNLEQPKIICRVLDIQNINELLRELSTKEIAVRYDKGGLRWIKSYQEIMPPQVPNPDLIFKQKGVYLITGGAGGLGLIFARYLAEHYHANLILTGRSDLKEKQKSVLAELEKQGEKVIYAKGDVTKKDFLEDLVKKVKDKFGSLNGVIHSAGVLRDAFILKKTQQQIAEVFSPKIEGTRVVDEVTQEEPLDFFVMFSSMVAIFGNVGQCDYAYANGFMNAFATQREGLRKENKRFGKTVSINWPLWAEGGMKVDEASQKWLKKTLGIIPLSNQDGIGVFIDLLMQEVIQPIVLAGDKQKIEKKLGNVSRIEGKQITVSLSVDDDLLLEKIKTKVIDVISNLLKIRTQEINIEDDISNYQMDSISQTEFISDINDYYRLDLTPAILFEHKTLKSFIQYLVAKHRSEMALRYQMKVPVLSQRSDLPTKPIVTTIKQQETDIAIIGMSGIFPGSPDLDHFWKNLERQQDLITEIPKERWDWQAYEPKVKWGGFIEGVDQFDAGFFNISPREAELMDPQQRIFLQTVWKAVEDAGYTLKDLSTVNTGLFVGVSTHDYAELLSQLPDISAHVSTGIEHSILANRVSYFLNLSGPSEPVDTACSSSLIAIHHAVKAIQNGDCELAIVGGVNALLTPTLYLSFSNAGMLSDDGRCKTFDKRANGYVRGEGVGAILLKPLNKALTDGDHIYGVIKGTAVNHGGHVSSLTVPNTNAQAEVIKTAIERANIDVDTISYIEVHGTGTSLGDPVEVNGLKKAFDILKEEQGKASLPHYYCGLSTVKTNIGHLEAAAGIAGVIKILLAMQHKKIPGVVNFKELNPYIEIKDSPFYIVDKTREWDSTTPRRAGVSSFGFGGANAHVVIEEALAVTTAQQANKPYYLITLSAKTDSSLQQRIIDLEGWLAKQEKISLEDISYTLNSGRNHFEKRCALIVASLNELQETLNQIKKNQIPANAFMSLDAQDESRGKAISKEIYNQFMDHIIKIDKLSINGYRDKLIALANFYVEGYDLDWNLLHQSESKRKISLPTYPFAKEHYWYVNNRNKQIYQSQLPLKADVNMSRIKLSQIETKEETTLVTSVSNPDSKISFPTLPEISNRLEYIHQRQLQFAFRLDNYKENNVSFVMTLGPETNICLKGHLVYGKYTLPTDAYIEMVHVACQVLFGKQYTELRDIQLVKPLIMNEKAIRKVLLNFKISDNKLRFGVFSSGLGEDTDKLLHVKGKINIAHENNINQTREVPSLDKGQKIIKLIGDDRNIGIWIDDFYRTIQSVTYSQNEAIAFLKQSSMGKKLQDHFIANPSMMSGLLALALITAKALSQQDSNVFLPIHIQSCIIYQPINEVEYKAFAKITYYNSLEMTFDMELINKKNIIVAKMDGLRVKLIRPDKIEGSYRKVTALSSSKEHALLSEDITMADYASVKAVIKNQLAQTLFVEENMIKEKQNFQDMGLDSILGVEFIKNIKNELKIELDITKLYAYPTLEKLVPYVVQQGVQTKPISLSEKISVKPEIVTTNSELKNQQTYVELYKKEKQYGKTDIAIIGMSGRFPDAKDIDAFWENLSNGVDSVREVPKERWDVNEYYDSNPTTLNKTYSRVGAFIQGVDQFDPGFFNISPKEAEIMDPQQRLFLEEAWKAIEDAGYSDTEISDLKCGVFVGVGADDYNELLSTVGLQNTSYAFTGLSPAILAARISYFLNLKGPSIAIDTACSSSLVALHQACMSTLSGECDIALSGGIALMLTPKAHIMTAKSGMTSIKGECRAFDQSADGIVLGEGVGVVVLKPLQQAIDDHNQIYGVIKASGINQDGATHGITAPNPDSQTALEISVYEKAKINSEHISYVETHGTGTPLGDPIELSALIQAFGRNADKIGYCAIGSVKTNIGHTSWAAGIVSVIKVLLSLGHKQIPPHLHFSQLNEHIKLENSPFYINTKLKDWVTESGVPRYAAVSSFGFSGTNAHVVIEEEPDTAPVKHANKPYYLVTLSAKTESSLKQRMVDLEEWLGKQKHLSLEDVSYTLNAGRSHFENRCALIVSNLEELREKLKQEKDNKHVTGYFEGNINKRPEDEAIYAKVLETTLEELKIKSQQELAQYKKNLEILANLYIKGYNPDWELLHQSESKQKIALPAYPFSRKRYWFDSYTEEKKQIISSQPVNMVVPYTGKEVLLEIINNNIAIIKMVDKNNRNMFSTELIHGLQAKFKAIKESPQIKVVIVTGYENIFCMGGDKAALTSIAEKKAKFTDIPFIYRGMLECDVPVIAAIQGHAHGGGFIFGLYADIIILSEENTYSASFMKYGFTPGVGATFIMKEKLGNVATEMMFTAKLFTGSELKNRATGIIFKKQGEVVNEAITIAMSLAEKPLQALKVLKKEIAKKILDQLPAVLEAELSMHEKTFSSPEVKERIQEVFDYTQHSQKVREEPKSQLVLKKISQELSPEKIVKEKIQTSLESIQNKLISIISRILHHPESEIAPNVTFSDLGADSIAIVEVIHDLNHEYNLALEAANLYGYPTIENLASFVKEKLAQLQQTQAYADKSHEGLQLDEGNIEKEMISDVIQREKNNTTKMILKSTNSKKINRSGIPYSSTEQADKNITSVISEHKIDDIGIIGMSGRFPDAENLDIFWRNLASGKNSIREIPKERWDVNQFYDPDPMTPNKTYNRAGAFIQGVDQFDPLFFSISPKETEMMDPQQRLFLEEAWKAIEDAGYSQQAISNVRCGVFVGVCGSDYTDLLTTVGSENTAQAFTGLSLSILTARISYLLNLKGPSLAIDTACSSSLVAIHEACKSILTGESDIALAGGVALMFTSKMQIMTSKAGMTSPTDACRTFDQKADGIVLGEGVGVVVLKPLQQAIKDGNAIYGVIKASGVNQDGTTNGITAPNPEAQTALEKEVYDKAGINPEHITYVEAHGTGTTLGDPIEISALTKAFRHYTNKTEYCAVGSVKTNIGHTTTAAGITSVIKVLLALKNKKIPPLIQFTHLNEHIKLKGSPFYINTELKDWETEPGIPRRAVISSFAYSGTNAHVLVEEAPPTVGKQYANKPFYFIAISAKSEKSLRQRIVDLESWLTENRDIIQLEDISYTLNVGRSHFNKRCAFIVSSNDDLKEKLSAVNNNRTITDYFRGNISKKPGDVEIYSKVLKTILEELKIQAQQKESDYKQNLETVANLYVKGYDPDWDLLHQGEAKQKIPLPTYPFDKKRYWIPEAGSDRQVIQSTINPPSQAASYVVLEKDWQLAIINKTIEENNSGQIAVLVNSVTFQNAKDLFDSISTLQPFYILDGEVQPSAHGTLFTMNFVEPQEGRQIADSILEKSPHLIGLVDLSDLNISHLGTVPWGKISFIQEILKNKINNPFYLLHMTKGLHYFATNINSLAGAEINPLIRSLRAEYHKLHAKTIDVDSLDNLKKVLLDEWLFDYAAAEIVYRDNKRYLPYLNCIYEQPVQTAGEAILALPVHPEKVYVLTGGVGGIGGILASYLVNRGAKRLVLMGKQPLPPRSEWDTILKHQSQTPFRDKITKIVDLEELGATVELYMGSLVDKDKLRNYFTHIRSEFGEIGGVIHCAGRVIDKNPAFINKETNDMQAVCEPKIAGLLTLHDIFKSDALDFFILFSSISAQDPSLGVGLSDYVMANGFMDYFAAYQFSQGYPYYRSIAWPSWKEIGMGEVKSSLYRQQGFLSVRNQEGLYLLEKVMSFKKQPYLIPAIVNPKEFNLDMVLLNCLERSTTATQHTEQSYPLLWLVQLFSEQLKIPTNELDPNTFFGDYGVDSIILAELVKKMERELAIKMDPSILLEYPTLSQLSQYITKVFPEMSNIKKIQDETLSTTKSMLSGQKSPAIKTFSLQAIAVIGVACHFPGAINKEQFWKNLMEGRSNITEVPPSRWDINELYSSEYQSGKSISKWGGFIEGIEYFDPEFFGIAKEDAPQVDPLERQFLEVSVEVLQDAGYETKGLWGQKVGVFVGSRVSNYAERIHQFRKNTIVGVGQNFIAAHVSHFLNFNGPNVVIDTACSSSLISAHMACQSLRAGECELAVAGGVDILLDEKPYLVLTELQALSPDGICHTFDETANGFVPGEGCGALLLKALDKAIADGDHIYAVIEGSAMNNDGHTMGITTPNPKAQEAVVEEALRQANIDPTTLAYIETHGTGTMIGDPMELRALTNVFNRRTSFKQYCAVGSVKTNIGHLASAAGIAGLIKVILSLYHKKLVPTLHCTKPNPRFDFEHSPFYPNVTLRDWEAIDGIRRAGVSSFGFGGTNAHCIVRDWDQKTDSAKRVSLSPIHFNRELYWIYKNKEGIDKKLSEKQKGRKLAKKHFDNFLRDKELL